MARAGSGGQYFIRSERAPAGQPLEHSLRYGLSGKIEVYAFIYSLSEHWDMAPETLTKWLERG